MPKLMIPASLKAYVGGTNVIELSGRTVGELLAKLKGKYPDIKNHLYDEEGKLRNFVNVYVGSQDIRHLNQLQTPLQEKSEVTIVPSVAGGSISDVFGERAKNVEFSNEEIKRYSRHLIMPEVGMEGQKRLKSARVLCVGTGGLGSPVSMYLAAAGVGTLGLIDFDVVDETNLQRQIVHGQSKLGKRKVDSARETLRDMNPFIDIRTHDTKLTSENALEILKDYDVIVDGTDNFATRYLVNDACVLLGKPNVYGSIFRFEGLVTVFHPPHSACYRCLYPEPPPPGLVPSCAEGGVLGILPGIIGVIQATETVKLILGIGESLAGRLLSFDALSMRFRQFELKKDETCPICGKNRTMNQLIDYEEFCGLGRGEEQQAAESSSHEVEEVEPDELKNMLDSDHPPLVLDVREPHEYEIVNMGGKLIPVGQISERMNELPLDKDIVVHCHHGMRSLRAAQILKASGFKRVKSLAGGIDRWALEVDPTLPRY